MNAEGFPTRGVSAAVSWVCSSRVLWKNLRKRKKIVPTTARIPTAAPMAISQTRGVLSAWSVENKILPGELSL